MLWVRVQRVLTSLRSKPPWLDFGRLGIILRWGGCGAAGPDKRVWMPHLSRAWYFRRLCVGPVQFWWDTRTDQEREVDGRQVG